MTTIADFLRAREADARVAIRFEDTSYTWVELLAGCASRAALLLDRLDEGRPPHVGVLLDNGPEYAMWLGAAALTNACIVGINPTRRGAELARDITHTDCQLVVTESRHASLLEGLDLGPATEQVLVTDDGAYASELAGHHGASLPDIPIDERAIYLLLFTSGTAGAPKACICTQPRLARAGTVLSQNLGLTERDVFYLAMPMFHSNALFAGVSPWLAVGGVAVFRRRFSASGWLPDVRRHGVTYFNYVGKPLSFILATPEQPDDADNPVRIAFGNEAAELDIERFSKRFGCRVVDGYGSTEGGANISRTPDTPKGSIGKAPDGTVILDPETGLECPPARFDANGRLLNADECIGEIVNKNGAAIFEGYYRNEEANQARVHDGMYWTGDLGYRDTDGFIYFAGRDFEWLRVDGENFAAAPVERIIARHPGVVLTAVYAVPDEDVGDQVMAALECRPGTEFDPEDFDAFLAEQTDLGTKWSPRYVRIMEHIPVTESQKPMKRQLRRERWEVADPVFWRPAKGQPLRRMTPDDVAALRDAFARRDRLAVLDTG